MWESQLFHFLNNTQLLQFTRQLRICICGNSVVLGVTKTPLMACKGASNDINITVPERCRRDAMFTWHMNPKRQRRARGSQSCNMQSLIWQKSWSCFVSNATLWSTRKINILFLKAFSLLMARRFNSIVKAGVEVLIMKQGHKCGP